MSSNNVLTELRIHFKQTGVDCRPSSYYCWGDVVVLESAGLSLSVESIYEQVRNEDVIHLLSGQ